MEILQGVERKKRDSYIEIAPFLILTIELDF